MNDRVKMTVRGKRRSRNGLFKEKGFEFRVKLMRGQGKDKTVAVTCDEAPKADAVV